MNVLFLFVAWCLLLAVCWPLAVLTLIAAPVVYLLSIPFRVVGLIIESVFSILRRLLIWK